MNTLSAVMGLERLEERRLCSAASPPTVAFSQYLKGSGTSRTFGVVYDGVDPIKRNTLDNNDIWVFGGNDFGARAVFVGSAKTKHGNTLLARYRIDGLAGGTYSIEMGEGQVTDTLGAQVDPGIIGAFNVGRRGRTTVLDPSRSGGMVQVIRTTWGPSSVPPAIDTAFGTVIGAMNFGGGAADVVGSTGAVVHFESRLASSLIVGAKRARAQVTTPFSVAIESPFAEDLFDATVGDQTVYESEVYTASNATETMEITGLDPTRTYQFQFLHGDTRFGEVEYDPTTQTFSLPSGATSQTDLMFGVTPGLADSNTVVVVTGTTSLRYDMPPAPARGPSFSGLVVSVSNSGPAPTPTPKLKRGSVRLKGTSHTFDLTYSGATAAGLASTNVQVTGPGGYSARATMVNVLFNTDGTQVATYRIDGVETTSSYSISVDGVDVGRTTLFFLVPVKWEPAAVVGRRHRH
jgi:hypothetical protein